MQIKKTFKLTGLALAVGLFTACSGSSTTNSGPAFKPSLGYPKVDTATDVTDGSETDVVVMMDHDGMSDHGHGHAEASAGHAEMMASIRHIMLNKIAAYTGEKFKATIEADHQHHMHDISGDLNWSVLDAEENVLETQEGGNSFEWTPDENQTGTFTLQVTQTMMESEITLSENIYVLSKVSQDEDLLERFWLMDEAIVGAWVGSQHNPYSQSEVTLIFKDDGSVMMATFDNHHMGGHIGHEMMHQMDGMSMMPYPMPPPFMPPPPYFPGDMGSSLNQQEGQFELLDIWANGEAEGILTFNRYGTPSENNLRRIRFSDDGSMLFFEWSRDGYGDSQLFVLTRADDLEPISSLTDLQAQLPGEWKGQAMTPFAEPFDVSFVFTADNYTAKAPMPAMSYYNYEPMTVSPFYFGEPVNDAAMDYQLSEYMDGKGSGDISIMLKTGEVVKGTISHMEMSLDKNMLAFTFMHYGKYGPVQYLLRREMP